jgi:hypothetical protein
MQCEPFQHQSLQVNLSPRAVLPAGGLYAPEKHLPVQIRQRTVQGQNNSTEEALKRRFLLRNAGEY